MTVERTTQGFSSHAKAVGWMVVALAGLLARNRSALNTHRTVGKLVVGQNRPSAQPMSEQISEFSLPTAAPAAKLNWTKLVKSLFSRFYNDRIMAVAAGTTFYALLAIFPALGALISLYGLVADPAAIQSQINGLSNVIPVGLAEIAGEQAKRIASANSPALSLGFISGLVLSIWSANAGLKALFDALNIVYEVRETRSFLRLNAISLAFTVGLIAFVVVALLGIVGLPLVANSIGLGGDMKAIVELARWPALLVVVALLLAIVYRFGPCLSNGKWRWISPGSATASVLWLGASVGFSWYATRFGSYNATYGTLGAAIALMTWMWLSLNIVLAGGEINMEFDRQAGTVSK